jgi:hypothetical protein
MRPRNPSRSSVLSERVAIFYVCFRLCLMGETEGSQMETLLSCVALLIGVGLFMGLAEDLIGLMKDHWKLTLVVIGSGVASLIFAAHYPEISAAILSAVTMYTGGALALAVVAFVWLSPIIVVGFVAGLLIDAISSATASKVQRRLRDFQ